MQRIQWNQGGTIDAYWERDGVAYDPGVTTVTITRDDATTLVASAATTNVSADPAQGRKYLLSPAQCSQLDFLTAVWTAADGSTMTSYVEIAGDYYFSVAYARSRAPLQDTSTYTVQNIVDYRTLAEMALEDIMGVAFVPRYSRHEASIVGWGLLEVPRRAIRSYSPSTVASHGVRQIYTSSDQGLMGLRTLSGLRVEKGGLIYMPSFWNWWSSPIEVAYEHGERFTPPRVARAAFELARRWLIESPWDERTTGFRTRDGGEMQLLTAGHTNPFDIPEVVAVAEAYSYPMVA